MFRTRTPQEKTSDPQAVEWAVIDGRKGAAPMVAVGILAVERAVGGNKLLGAADARVAKIEVGDAVQIRGNVALLARPLRLQTQFQSIDMNLNNTVLSTEFSPP